MNLVVHPHQSPAQGSAPYRRRSPMRTVCCSTTSYRNRSVPLTGYMSISVSISMSISLSLSLSLYIYIYICEFKYTIIFRYAGGGKTDIVTDNDYGQRYLVRSDCGTERSNVNLAVHPHQPSTQRSAPHEDCVCCSTVPYRNRSVP